MKGGFRYEFGERFKRDFKRLDPEMQGRVTECIKDLLKDPIPASRRAHRINTDQFPKVFSVDVTSNKAYKLSFHLSDDGQTVHLRRIGTHSEIDRIC